MLLTAYLGAGKTTIFEPHSSNTEGIHAAVIVNDIMRLTLMLVLLKTAAKAKEGGQSYSSN